MPGQKLYAECFYRLFMFIVVLTLTLPLSAQPYRGHENSRVLSESWENPINSRTISGDQSTGQSLVSQPRIISTQQDSNLSLIGRLRTGAAYAVATRADTVYYGKGYVFVIADFTDPAHPVELGELSLSGTILDIDIVENYAFIANGMSGLCIIDISNPDNPVEVSSESDSIPACAVSVQNGYAYVTTTGSFSITRIFDVHDPLHPEEINYLDVAGATYDAAIQNSYAYLATVNGLEIFDITDPHQPIYVGIDSLLIQPVSVTVQGHYVYVINGSYGISIIDISDAENPVTVGYLHDVANYNRIRVDGNYAYITKDYGNLDIVNISDPTNPQLVEEFETSRFTRYSSYRMSIENGRLYLATGNKGLFALDVSIPGNPTILGYIPTGGTANDITIQGEYAYIANGDGGFWIVNISDPSQPKLSSAYYTAYEPHTVSVRGNFAYVYDGVELLIFDISNPNHPVVAASYRLNDPFYKMTFQGDYAITANGTSGLSIYNIQNALAPVEIGHYQPPYQQPQIRIQDVFVRDNFAYVANNSKGLQVFSLQDFTNPVEVTHSPPGGLFPLVAHNDQTAILTGDNGSLRILDIQDPSQIHELGEFTPANNNEYVEAMIVGQHYVYLAKGFGSLQMINIDNPSTPVYAGYFHTNFYTKSVTAKGRYLYVTDDTDGLYILQNDLGDTFPSEPIHLGIGSVEAYIGDTVSVGITVSFPPDSQYASAEINLTGYESGLNFLGIDTTNSLIGTAGWSYSVSEDNNLELSFSSNGNSIDGSGVLVWLKYVVFGNRNSFAPIEFISASFNSSENSIDMVNGGVSIGWLHIMGDVNNNLHIEDIDARLILRYLTGDSTINLFDPVAANVSEDQTISALDASLIFRYKSGLQDTLPVDTTAAAWIGNGSLSASDASMHAAEPVDIPFQLSQVSNAYAFQGKITYDPNILEFDSLSWGEILAGFTTVSRTEEGVIKFAVASTEALNESGDFLTPHFTVTPELDTSQTSVTMALWRLNEGAFYQYPIQVVLSRAEGIADPHNNIPDSYVLQQNHPNPFNPTTTIRYALPENSRVTLEIYDLLGRRITTLVNKEQTAGWYSVRWNGLNQYGISVSSGVYFYRLKAGEYQSMRKMLYLK